MSTYSAYNSVRIQEDTIGSRINMLELDIYFNFSSGALSKWNSVRLTASNIAEQISFFIKTFYRKLLLKGNNQKSKKSDGR